MRSLKKEEVKRGIPSTMSLWNKSNQNAWYELFLITISSGGIICTTLDDTSLFSSVCFIECQFYLYVRIDLVLRYWLSVLFHCDL